MAGNAAYYVAAAVVAGAAVESEEANKRAKKAEDIQEERADVERAVQHESAARSRRAEVRKRLVATGEIENLAVQTGGSGGTAATQSVASVATNTAANTGAISEKVGVQNQLSNLQTDLFKTQTPTGLERGASLVQSAGSAIMPFAAALSTSAKKGKE